MQRKINQDAASTEMQECRNEKKEWNTESKKDRSRHLGENINLAQQRKAATRPSTRRELQISDPATNRLIALTMHNYSNTSYYIGSKCRTEEKDRQESSQTRPGSIRRNMSLCPWSESPPRLAIWAHWMRGWEGLSMLSCRSEMTHKQNSQRQIEEVSSLIPKDERQALVHRRELI